MLRTIAVLLVLVLAHAAHAEITVPATIAPYKPIVAVLKTANVPPGAQVRGTWSVTGGDLVQVQADTVHVWAPPGTYTVTASGVWVLTEPVEVNGKTIPVLIDFGQYSESATFTVGGVVPPVPPPTPSKAWGVILEETRERTPQQAALWLKVRSEFQAGPKLLILDQDSPDAAAYLSAVGGLSLPVLLVCNESGQVVSSAACPTTLAAIKKALGR